MADKPLKIEGPERIERHHEGEDTLIKGGSLKLLGIIGAVILVVAGGWFFFNRQAKTAETEASIALGRISSYLNQGDYEKAINGDQTLLIDNRPIIGLASIVAEYGSTNTGKRAALMLGNAYMATEKYQEAATAFEVASESGDELTRAAALAGSASVAEAEGKYEEAATRYDEAAALYKSDVSRSLYLFAAAKNYENASKNEEAIKRYREIAMEYPTSEQNNVARLALARHGVEI
ncbi:MAG: tetratricopeptide repeat protein [Candidatus Kapaibacterium sp.]